MNINVIPFYLDGRVNMSDEDEQPETEIDMAVLAQKIVKGADVAATIRDAAKAALARYENTDKRGWVAANKKEIKASGATESAAWDAFCAGRVDELCLETDSDIVDAIETCLEPDGGEDDEDEEDDDDDDAEEDEGKH